MTAQKAYVKGFCKVAEARGVNPEELYKYAQANALVPWAIRGASGASRMGGRLSSLLGKVKKPFQRYMELLGGGNANNVVQGMEDVAARGGFKRTPESFLNMLKNNPELQKVTAARIATLGGLAGVGTVIGEHKAYNRGREGKKMNWWNY